MDLRPGKKGVAAKKLAEHLELENFFGDTRVLVESFGKEKLLLVLFPGSQLKFPNYIQGFGSEWRAVLGSWAVNGGAVLGSLGVNGVKGLTVAIITSTSPRYGGDGFALHLVI